MLPILGTLVTAGMSLIDKFYPSEESKAEAKLNLLKLQQEGNLKELEAELERLRILSQVDLAQANTNTVEASSTSLFKSGWRPMLGWVTTGGFATNLIGIPFMNYWTGVYNAMKYGTTVPTIAPINLEDAIVILLGMLGLSSIRAVEKCKRVS